MQCSQERSYFRLLSGDDTEEMGTLGVACSAGAAGRWSPVGPCLFSAVELSSAVGGEEEWVEFVVEPATLRQVILSQPARCHGPAP